MKQARKERYRAWSATECVNIRRGPGERSEAVRRCCFICTAEMNITYLHHSSIDEEEPIFSNQTRLQSQTCMGSNSTGAPTE